MELILHIGAHRTATTAMQDMFVANNATLDERAIKALVHRQLGGDSGFSDVVHQKDWGQPRAWIKAQTKAAQKVIISDENMIGDMGWNVRSGTFYNRASIKLTAYRDFLAQTPTRIGLGIRHYASYWLSAHGQELLYRNMKKQGVPRFDDLRPALLAAKRGWLDLIADVRAVFKTAEIVVWPVEAKIPINQLGQRLLNEEGLMLTPPPAGVNSGPKTGVIPALETFRAAHLSAPRAKIRAWLETQQTTGYQGFSTEEMTRLGQRYQSDIDALKQGFAGVTFLQDVRELPVVAKQNMADLRADGTMVKVAK